jgi:hypothetical protein
MTFGRVSQVHVLWREDQAGIVKDLTGQTTSWAVTKLLPTPHGRVVYNLSLVKFSVLRHPWCASAACQLDIGFSNADLAHNSEGEQALDHFCNFNTV